MGRLARPGFCKLTKRNDGVGNTAEGFTRGFKEVVALEEVILRDPKLSCSGAEAGNIGRVHKAVCAWVDASDRTWFELVEEAGWEGGAVGQPAQTGWKRRGRRAYLHRT